MLAVLIAALTESVAEVSAGEPAEPVEFRHARVTEAWQAYADRLSFGEGQTLALAGLGRLLAPAFAAHLPDLLANRAAKRKFSVAFRNCLVCGLAARWSLPSESPAVSCLDTRIERS